MTAKAFQPLRLKNGAEWKHRVTLAALTNKQSHADGRLSSDEISWLRARAAGDFAMVMTAAAHVRPEGQAFEGQLGVFADHHDAGLQEMATALRAAGAASALQLHHGGSKASAALSGLPTEAPSEGRGARALSGAEVEAVIADFIAGAVRAQKAGFDGVEVHGAHGYLLCQFLSVTENRREDDWGGSYEKRTRIVREIVSGIRRACGADFTLGLRLSPERYGIETAEALRFAAEMMAGGEIDYLDISCWDCFKEPEDQAFKGRRLMDLFMDLPRHGVALGVAGKLYSAADVQECFSAGADFVLLGRAGIVHAAFPKLMAADPGFAMAALPVSADHLRGEALSETFVNYMATWPGFVAA